MVSIAGSIINKPLKADISTLISETILDSIKDRTLIESDNNGIIKGKPYINPGDNHTRRSKEVLLMEEMFPPWGVAVLEGPSIGSMRNLFFKARSKGAVLFHIPFDSFNPMGSPESSARFGVIVVQAASFLKGAAIASLRPGRMGGRVPERSLPEPYRIDYLRSIISQGFSWVELEDDIPKDTRDQLISQAKAAGSRVIISTSLKSMMEWTPSDDINRDKIDGYRIIAEIMGSKDLRRAIRASKNARKWLPGKKIIVEPSPASTQFSKMLIPISISDLVPLSIYEMQSLIEGQDPTMGRERHDVWRTIGIVGNDISRDWSAWKRELTVDTKFYIQIGNNRSFDFRNRLFNIQFNKRTLDAIMIPWRSIGKDIIDCLKTANSMDVHGAIIEMPLRSQIIPHLDWIDPRSEKVGSVDVVSFRGGKVHGYNSEIYGISDQITREDVTKGSKFLILGTGASGRAAAMASRMLGMETYIAGNNKDRALEVASKLGGNIKGTSYRALSKPGVKFDMVINTIPFETRSVRGGADQMMEIADLVKNMDPLYGMDLYYHLPWTPFLSSVESRGGKPVSGVEILLRSTMRSFKLTTGLDGSEPFFRKGIEELVLTK
jgi:shikimate 5-dehydrogenase